MRSRLISKSAEILAHNKKFMPGGVCSINRLAEPDLVFVKAEGAYIWDADGQRYTDYHAAFGPHFLGHNHLRVTQAVGEVLHNGVSLFGSGTTELEGRLAELLCSHIEVVDSVVIMNTGSEATAAAIRLSRAVTERDHVVVMQGGYNGLSDSLACNLMNSVEEIGPRVSPGEYRYVPMGAGMAMGVRQSTHIVNFNDIDSVRYVCERYPIAALITEPILQNIGVVHPQSGYLEDLRRLADQYGFLLIFDEVKTGFRHALGGYSEISGVRPDLVIYGKAVANGFPLSILGGKQEYMNYMVHPNPSRRPLVAGTYNGHPVPVAASIATVECLLKNDGEIYGQVERLGRMMQEGIESILKSMQICGVVARQGSAFVLYFMDHVPRDWHDLVQHHDFARDVQLRQRMIERGIFYFPVATKQCSISAAHSGEDIVFTLERLNDALKSLRNAAESSVTPVKSCVS